MHRVSRISRYMLGMAALALILSACGGSTASAPTPTPAPVAAQPTAAPVAGTAINVGVLNNRSAVVTNNEWLPLMEYLSGAVGQPFKLVALKPEDVLPAIEQGIIDIGITNSLVAVQARRLYNTNMLATLSNKKTGTLFGGLIIVKNNSSIQKLEDIRGKRVGFFSRGSAGAYAFQLYHLLPQGIKESDLNMIEISSQDNLVLALMNDKIDVGFIRTGQLEKMKDANLIMSIDDFRILDPAKDDFVYPHTTALYPEWAAYSSAKMDTALSQKLQKALLDMPEDHAALKAAGIQKFVAVVDYSAIDKLIEALKLTSWDATP